MLINLLNFSQQMNKNEKENKEIWNTLSEFFENTLFLPLWLFRYDWSHI